MDETAVMADIILPSHTAIEDWGDDFPEPGPGIQAATISQPAVSPVFNTKGVGDIFLAIARKTGGKTAEKFAWDGYGDYLRDAWKGIYSANKDVAVGSLTFDDFWVKLLANGGWWEASKDGKKTALSVNLKAAEKLLQNEPCAFDGDPKDFPHLVLHPHTRLGQAPPTTRGFGRSDPVTSVVWGVGWSSTRLQRKARHKTGRHGRDRIPVRQNAACISLWGHKAGHREHTGRAGAQALGRYARTGTQPH